MPNDEEVARQLARWQRATLDATNLPILDELFQGATSAHARHLGDALYGMLESLAVDAPERPLVEMLASILCMHERPTETPPFGPMLVMADGSRSAAPEDFAGPLIEVMVAVLGRIDHPVVRARLAHLVWFLERRRRDEGVVALQAYIDVIEHLDDGRLLARDERSILGVTGRDLLRMAFSVCRGLGRPAEEHDRLKTITEDLLRRAEKGDDYFGLRLFSDLALDENAMRPEDIAGILEAFLEPTAATSTAGSHDDPAEMWLLAARAYRLSGEENAAIAAMIRASESYAALAETFVGRPQGAMLAAHWMGISIATLHGVPGVRERRQELRQRLIGMQGEIRDDLVPISHSTDVSKLVQGTREQFRGLPLEEALRRLTFAPGNPPEPEKLVEEARQTNEEHPLSSLFAASHMDAEGKTIARSPGGGISGEDATAEAFEQTIMQSEGIRRGFTARTCIDVARVVVMAEHHISEDILLHLVRHSPAVPPHLLRTTAKGFARWFEGDMVSALYILTPLLEGILRHLLKQHGHDVTTMDDATKTQQDRTITALYDTMRPEMDAILGRALTEDIRRTFLSKLGPSLRHGVAHALLSDGTPYGDDATYACWLIWMIVAWPLIPYWDDVVRSC